MTDWQGTTIYSYDVLGRLVAAQGPETNERMSYAYDALGNRVSMTDQDGETVGYGYDALNRLTNLTDGAGVTTYTYDPLSNITRISYPNGASVNYSYDVMDRLLLVVNNDAKNKKAGVFGYVYDPAGMVTRILQEGGVSVEYGYDALNRLVRETRSKEAKRQEVKIKYDHQYSYDAVGNRVELVKHKGGEDGKQIKETYSYDAGNRLMSLKRDKEKDGLPVLAEAVHYNYDNNGNRMSKEETKFDDDGQETEVTYYGYDHENRLTSLEYVGDQENILNASFEYDGNGLRRKATEGSMITKYYYDGLNVLFEKDAAGLTQKSYTRGLGFPGGIGGLISMKRFEQEDDGLEEKTSYYPRVARTGQKQDRPLRIFRQGSQKLIHLASRRQFFHASDRPDDPLAHAAVFTVTFNDLQIRPARRLFHAQEHGRLLWQHHNLIPCSRRQSRITSSKRGTTFSAVPASSPSRPFSNRLRTVEERYKDLEESDVLVFIGANPCIAHPILWERVVLNPYNPRIIVVDPRKTETAMAATRHYALDPKSDLVLFYGLARILIEEGWIDREFIDKHTKGFEDFRAHVQSYTPEMAARVSGLTQQELYEFAATIHHGKRVSFWWTMGVNQSYEGVRTAQAIINLALMTGNIGRPGTGANSITGQCNAMGSRLFSNTTNLLGGHNFLNAEHRRKIARILEIEENCIPQENSLAYDQIIEGIIDKKIKGLWIIATNPVHSWINQNALREYLKNLEFLVVQDMYHTTDTARLAHLVLPAAAWGEKDGTFINSERRLGIVKKTCPPPGDALADFDIFKLIARYWGCERMFAKWESPQAVFEILKEISRGQPCDITGIKDYKMIEEQGGIQWPYPCDACPATRDLQGSNERRLFQDGRFFHEDGKARFIFEKERTIPETVDKNYPFILLTGRGTSSQWHTQTRTAKSAILRKMYPQDVYVEINPRDAKTLQIKQGQWVYVSTLRGKVRARAIIIPTVKPGQIFMPMHYVETNQLTLAMFDFYSRQPSYKICAARISIV